MKKIYSDKNVELRFGDAISYLKHIDIKDGLITILSTGVLNEENLEILCNVGAVTVKEVKEEPITLNTVYSRIAKKSNLSVECVIDMFEIIDKIYPMATVSIIMRQLAEILDEKYEDHISDSDEIYSVSTINGKITQIPKEHIKNYKHFAAFRTKEDAVIACKLLKKFFKEMYK